MGVMHEARKLVKEYYFLQPRVFINRKNELIKRHSDEESLGKIYFAFDHVSEVLNSFDFYEETPGGAFLYVKDYSSLDYPFLCVIVEQKRGGWEIVSIHFKEKKKNK